MSSALLLLGCRAPELPPPPVPDDATATVDTAPIDTGPTAPDPTADTATTDPTAPPLPDELVFDEAHVLVVPDHDGLRLLRSDGTTALSRTWRELGELACDPCGGEGATADGDGLLVAYTTDEDGNGAIRRLDAAFGTVFRRDALSFPHDAIRDPADGALVVSESPLGRLVWLPGDGTSATPLRTLDTADEDWTAGQPNGLEAFGYDGRTLLLVSNRGSQALQGTGDLTLWDIGRPDAPVRLWRYPSEGSLDMPHGPLFRRWEDRWWLVYAHSGGAAIGGSVGLAVTDDPTVLPAYVADLAPTAPVGPLVYPRGVELTSDGWLWVTDSGDFGGQYTGNRDGRVLRAPIPSLEPTGATGAVGFAGSVGDQVLLPLIPVEVVVEGLSNPFEGWLWAPIEPLPSP